MIILETVCSIYSSKNKIGFSSFNEGQITYKEFCLENDLTLHISDMDIDIILLNEGMQRDKYQVIGKVIMLKAEQYHEQKIVNSLLQLQKGQDGEDIRYNRLRKILDFGQDEVIKSMGMLISYLVSYRHITTNFDVSKIKSQSSNVQISSSTYQYLQLLRQQIHPSSATGTSRGKQGFTVFNLYSSMTSTANGSKFLLQKFLRPLVKKQQIIKRQNVIGFMHTHLFSRQKQITQSLRKISNLKVILKKIELAKVQPDDWKKLQTSLQNIMILYSIFHTLKIQDNHSIVHAFGNFQFIQEVNETLSFIQNVISFQPFQIKSNVSEDLDRKRYQYSKINLQLQALSIKYANSWQIDVKIVYIPQVGYLVNTLKEVKRQGWKFEFMNDAGYFYSNSNTLSLDREQGDKYAIIQDIQKQIMVQLEDLVKQRKHHILQIYRMTGELDSLFAIAKISKNFVKPFISQNTFIINNGRHILLQGDPITNNTFSYPFTQQDKQKMYNSQINLANANYSNRCLLISGANGSGKTLYAKQVAIILFLAHIGSYVPAEKCVIPIVDSIQAFNPSGSLLHKKSGIKEQLLELNRIISNLTRKSFVIIDEFGHCCSYFEAERIIYSLIQYFTNFDFSENKLITETTETDSIKVPFSIVITHMKDLFNKDLKYTPHLRQIQTLINTSNNTAIDYLYKISPGCYLGNHGIQVCRNMGLDDDFIEIAFERYQEIQQLKSRKQKQFYLNQDLLQRIKKYQSMKDNS